MSEQQQRHNKMMMYNRRLLINYLLISLIVLCCIVPVAAQAFPVNIAFLSIDNLSANPRYDYLEGIIRGLMLFDLSEAIDIEVVTRRDLDSVLREQELQLSKLAEDQNKAIEVGRILGADYLLRGEYVFLGNDVLITIRLIDVVDARSLTFSERGATENTLHAIAEQIIFRLTGREVMLQSEQHARSIISLQDEKSGSIHLYCNLKGAEIYVDDGFVGYTAQNTRIPFEIEGLSPGTHSLRIHLSEYGVVKVPEITFHDWEEQVQIPPGKHMVVRATIDNFNDTIRELAQLIGEQFWLEKPLSAGPVRIEREASFVDRNGKTVHVGMVLALSLQGDHLNFTLELNYQGEIYSWDLSAPFGDRLADPSEVRQEFSKQVGKVEVRVGRYRWDLRYGITRTDIERWMFRNQ